MSDSEIIKDFLVESYENLDRLDRDLVNLESNPTDRQILASVFRTIHTIKGTAGFLAFPKLEKVTHVGENLLAKLRDGELTLNPEITTALLAMVDAVRSMLATIEAKGNEGERNDDELVATLTRLLQPAGKSTPPSTSAPKAEPHAEAPKVGEILVSLGATTESQVQEAVSQQDAGDPRRVGEILVEAGTAKPQEVLEALNAQQQAKGQSASDSTIRVDVSLLDQLMNLVGELVLARNQVLQFTNSTEASGLLATSQRLNLITTELQEGVMKTRMQPIGNIWSKFPRTVRDVALNCGKQVRIEMEGRETELDKTIIEAIKDPLTHLVRNAVDHGIESPEVRRAAGKNPEGLLLMRAFHEGGQVNIEIIDDGAGLDLEKIRNKAVQKGLVSADQAARMSEREIVNLIFLPGFSTAEKVTNVSGRGVGMDVVKTNIEKIGGTVDMQTRLGQGSTVRMKIPLTLAIIPALMITTAGDRYAIPQVSLLELVRLEGEQAKKSIELVNGAPVHRLRGRLLPLVYLRRELQTEGAHHQNAQATSASAEKSDFVDLAQVRQGHYLWTARLRQLLDGKSTLTLEESGNFRECGLGKWLYSTGLSTYGDIPEIRTLEETHRHFHESVHRVVSLKLGGQQAAAEAEFASVEQVPAKIIDLLTIVEKKVASSQNVNIVVLRADDREFGLVVDEVNDTEEIVVKPLSKQLKSINTYAGATIMGDGRVALILDVMGLAQRANVVGESRDRGVAEAEGKTTQSSTDATTRNAVLVFKYGDNGRMAIDLGQVARLEEFPADAIEVAGDYEVVQYRGQIMPLIRVSDVLRSSRIDKIGHDTGALQVVVYSDEGRSVGLVVDRILDIVEESFVMQRQTGRQGMLGSAVIQKHVTDILDVPGLIAAADKRSRAAAASA